jgi:hypothetical protein
MRSKLLIMSTAALLAGTLAAAGQSIQSGGGAQEKSQSSQGTEAPKAGQKAGPAQKSQTQGQAERDQDKAKSQGQAQRDQDKSKTQGQAQRDQDKAKSQTQGQADQDKSKSQGQTQREQDKSKSQTQGQAPREQDRQQGQTQRDQDRQQNQGPNQRDQGRNQQGAREGDRGGNVSVSFTTEQRTKIRETVFKERNAPRVSKVGFSIREGTVIPRTVHVVEVPDVIVQIHPEWRGYKYFIVNNELVIVESDTLRIVAVIDV